jgi:hypothetical protein
MFSLCSTPASNQLQARDVTLTYAHKHHLYMYTTVRTYTHTHIHTHVHIYIHKYVCMYYTHTRLRCLCRAGHLFQSVSGQILEAAVEQHVLPSRERLPEDVVLRAHAHQRVDAVHVRPDVEALHPRCALRGLREAHEHVDRGRFACGKSCVMVSMVCLFACHSVSKCKTYQNHSATSKCIRTCIRETIHDKFIFASALVYIYICIYMYIYMYIYVYIRIYICSEQ